MAATATKEKDQAMVNARKVKSGHLMAFIYYATVEDASPEELLVNDVDRQENFLVKGKTLIESSYSADQYTSTKRTTKTKVAEVLVSSHNRPLTVCFEKVNGTERVLRGRLVKPEPLLGRSMVEDLDLDAGSHRLRQVDHRTIKWLIVDSVKYTVRS